MKQTPYNKAIRDIHTLAMTPAEKQAVLVRVKSARGVVPSRLDVVYPSSVRSPWTTLSFGSWVRGHRFVTVVAAFLIVAISGNSIVLASNEAVPGDALYPFKVKVAEPIRVALAIDPVEKAEVQTSLVQNRFEEAEVLAARGELNDDVEREISSRIDEHLAEVEKSVEEMQKTYPDRAQDANIAVEASMNAHAKILDTLEPRISKPWASNTVRIAAKARETAKKFEVRSEDDEDGKNGIEIAIADEAPVAAMMSFATTAPAPEAVEVARSVPVVDGGVDTQDTRDRSRMAKGVSDEGDDSRAEVSTLSKRSKDVDMDMSTATFRADADDEATSTPVSIEVKKQKKEKEVYEKARQRIEKELKKEEIRMPRDVSNEKTIKDHDDRDDENSDKDKRDERDRDDDSKRSSERGGDRGE